MSSPCYRKVECTRRRKGNTEYIWFLETDVWHRIAHGEYGFSGQCDGALRNAEEEWWIDLQELDVTGRQMVPTKCFKRHQKLLCQTISGSLLKDQHCTVYTGILGIQADIIVSSVDEPCDGKQQEKPRETTFSVLWVVLYSSRWVKPSQRQVSTLLGNTSVYPILIYIISQPSLPKSLFCPPVPLLSHWTLWSKGWQWDRILLTATDKKAAT